MNEISYPQNHGKILKHLFEHTTNYSSRENRKMVKEIKIQNPTDQRSDSANSQK